MSNPRSSEQALSDLTIGGDNATGAFAPAVQVAAARGAFFRKPGVTKADVQNDTQDAAIASVSTALIVRAFPTCLQAGYWPSRRFRSFSCVFVSPSQLHVILPFFACGSRYSL
jgi:hypothetical protein